MKFSFLFFLTLVLVLIGGQALYARLDPFLDKELERLKGPVVIELFTSQSCSSCPPADALLGKVSEHEDVIALSFHVTYWNYLHWKDTLSRKFSEDRQRSYAAQRGSRRVYTPQMVVNGRDEFTGSNASKLKRALSKAKALGAVELSLDAEQLQVAVPELEGRVKGLKFWLFGTQDTHVQDIPSGENRGRTVRYTNAVLYEKDLGTKSGEFKAFNVKRPDWDGIDRLVVLVQDGAYGEVIAAGALRL